MTQPITTVMKMIAGRLQDPKLVAIPRLLIREMIHFPEFAQMYRHEVLDRVIPAVTQLIRNGIAEGYFRPVDPELAIRSIIGPIALHMMMAEIFSITPADGLAIDRFIESRGIEAPVEARYVPDSEPLRAFFRERR